MMIKSIFVLFFLAFFSTQSYAKQSLQPKGDCSQKIHHTYYSLCYEETHRQASWVKYQLTPKMLDGMHERSNHFRQDPNVEDPVGGSDYRGSGFDRGHLVPSADMRLSAKMNKESFFMTNVSPQKPGFNRGIWVKMEAYVRDRVAEWGVAHVISAPILHDGLKSIESGVSIPKRYYKIAYFPKKKTILAFLVSNQSHDDANPEDFLVPLDEIEEITGFDFFNKLPNDLEKKLESEVPLEF